MACPRLFTHPLLITSVLSALVLSLACGGDDNPSGPTTGSIRIATATTGADLDPDGYAFSVDAGTAQAIGVNATATIASLATGSHTVALSGLAANCSVTGSNPQTVNVTAGGTAQVSFAIACTSLTGNIQVTVASTGAAIPASYSVAVDGGNPQTVPANGSVTFSTLPIGNHTVALTVTAANCTVTAPNPRTVSIPAGATTQTVQTSFAVACTSTDGFIQVLTTATGANIPTTFSVVIDGTTQAAVAAGGNATYGPLPLGNHTVQLGVAANCTVTAPNPRTVSIPAGATQQTAQTSFAVACTSTEGFIEVLTTATGANIPTTFSVTIDGQIQTAVVAGSGHTYGPLAVGNHTVLLGVAANCTVTAPNPRTVNIPSGAAQQTAQTSFAVSCTSSDYALSLTPAALSIKQGANENTAVTITRTNFAGAVTLSLGNAPSGVTGVFNPAAPTGTSSTLTVSVGAAVPLGVYQLTVNGTATAGDRSTPLTLTVESPSGGGNVTVDFSACTPGERPLWVAFQDDTGPWTVVTGVNGVYQFSVAGNRGGFAYVQSGVGTSSTTVEYLTRADLTGTTQVFCAPTSPGKTINGTAAGITAFDQTRISLGGGTAIPTAASLNFQITGVANGTHDLAGYRRSTVGGPERAIIRRDQNIADNGSVGTVDFGAVEAFVPATAAFTAGGVAGGETVSHNMVYQVGASCTSALLYSAQNVGASFTASGIPGLQQRASDFHVIVLSAVAANALRSISESFHTLAARTVTLGAALPGPAITTLSGPYLRLQAAYTLPADYNGSTTFAYSDGSGNSVSLTATFSYLGGASVTLGLADYSGLAGWNNSWAPASGSTGDWSVSAFGGNAAGSACTENASTKSASVSGTF